MRVYTIESGETGAGQHRISLPDRLKIIFSNLKGPCIFDEGSGASCAEDCMVVTGRSRLGRFCVLFFWSVPDQGFVDSVVAGLRGSENPGGEIILYVMCPYRTWPSIKDQSLEVSQSVLAGLYREIRVIEYVFLKHGEADQGALALKEHSLLGHLPQLRGLSFDVPERGPSSKIPSGSGYHFFREARLSKEEIGALTDLGLKVKILQSTV